MTDVLGGVRVIETASFVSGPYVGQLLSDLGADVIKVESPRGGDPFRAADGYSPQFRSYNSGKRSIAIDLATEAGVAVFRRIARQSDILVENYRPGVMDKLGVGADALCRDNPRLIYCSLTGFGPDGPYRHRPAYDSVAGALSGFFNQTMFADNPQIIGPAISDAVTGLYGVYGVLGALFERERTGRGRRVEINMVEAMVAFLRQPFESYFESGNTPDPLERPSFSTALAFQCSDRKPLAIHVSTPEKFWDGLLDATGRLELRDDIRFATRAARVKNFRELISELRPTFMLRARAEWMARLDERDVPFAPINDFREVESDLQLRHLGTFGSYTHLVHGEMKAIHRPVFYDRAARHLAMPPPTLGEHSLQVLEEHGFSAAEQQELTAMGIIT